jgi:integrase
MDGRTLRAGFTGTRLGYRRHQLGGKWLWSVYNGDGSYSAKTFAGADDFLRPDGERILDYGQAIARVRELASAPPIGPTTVAEAMDAYFKRLAAKGKKTADAERRANTHIIKPLGAVPVDALTRDILDRWLANVANGRDGAGPTRARKATANRVATILHAALNQAFRDDKCASDRAWKACTRFASVNAPRERFFTQDELTRLINASQGDFRLLVKSALLSGARYSELCRLRVADFNQDQGFIHIDESKSGRPRDIFLTAEGHQFFVGLTAGRAGSSLMLTRDGKPWRAGQQGPPMRRAMQAARIEGGSFHTLPHCAASWWLMAGVSLTAVARNLGP